MVRTAQRGQVGRLSIEHQLEIVRAVGHPEVDPVEVLAIAASAPDFLESKNVAIELHCGGDVADGDAGVPHAGGDSRIRQVFSEVLNGPTVGFILDDLDLVAVGVGDVEVQVADLALGDFRRHLDSA